jgi:hypothetical protein
MRMLTMRRGFFRAADQGRQLDIGGPRYHAGADNDPAQKQYVCQVITNMVASGFGAWTANARAFCNMPAP